jgi:hypothetical protein
VQYVSEVARIKAEIERDYQAGKLALHGFAQVASHAAANRSMEHMWNEAVRVRETKGEEAMKAFLMKLQ